MKIKKGFVVRIVGGESIAVPVGELSKNFHGMITLNETAKFLWDFFQNDHTPDEALTALQAEYDVDEELAKKDITTFLNMLAKNQFLE